MNKRILAAGYFGCGNLGDDALLLAFNSAMSAAGHTVTAMSGAPELTYRNLQIQSIPRKDLKKFKESLKENDVLVFPGGSIFQDVTSARSALYYAQLIKIAKNAGKPVFMISQGIGPLTKWLSKRTAISALQSVDLLAVRDPESARTLMQMGVRRPVEITADLTFLLNVPTDSNEAGSYQVAGMKSIGLAPRPHGKNSEIVQLFGELARGLMGANYVPLMIEMDTKQDNLLIDAIEKSQGGKVPGIRKIAHPMDLMRRLHRMEAVVSMRLHGGILATACGVPCIMLSYDPKVQAFAKEAGVPCLSMNNLTPDRVLEAVQVLIKDHDGAKQRTLLAKEKLAKLAQKNVDLVLERL